MKTKVLDINDNLHLVCIKDSSRKYNPYRLYLFFPAKDRYGYPTEHRKQIAEYGDMHSIVCHVSDLYKVGMQNETHDRVLAWNKQYYNPA